MFTKKRQATLGILAALGGLALATTAAADTPSSTVILNTATTLIKEAPNSTNTTKPVSQKTGAGIMDPHITYEPATGLLASTMTWSAAKPNNNNSYMQGALALATLDPVKGLSDSTFIELPILEGDRPHMRPNVAIGSNFVMDVFSSEDHSDNNNGNPQVVAWIFDKTGKMLTITNSTRNDPQKPTNLIDKTGNNDGQQYGVHSVLALGPQADGSEGFILGVQRNNQQAQVLAFTVKADGAGNAVVNGLYRKTIIQNAQHNRVSLAIPPDFIAHNGTVVATAVEANTQPANIGVRAVLVDVKTGKALASTLIAKSDPNNKMYAVQPTVQYVTDDLVTIEYQMSQTLKPNGNNGNGHADAAANLSNLALLKVPSAGGQFTTLDSASRVAPYQSHSEAFGMQYGPDNAVMPAVGAIGGSRTGYGKGLVQVIPIDVANGKLGAIDPMKLYEVSQYSDVAMLQARGKRNPNDQARGFIRGLSGIANPGFGNTAGFMPEVKTFSISAVAGYKDATTSNRESLFFSLIPSVWTHAVATVPGSVTPTVPPGPSPVATPPAQGGPTPTNPGVGTTSTGDGNSSSSSSSGDMPSVPSTPSGTGPHAPGFSSTDTQAAGCACTTAPGSSSTSGLAGLSILAMGLALLGIRRGKKES